MKRVLIISYYWPPAGGPGSQRMVKFVKFLPHFNWNPVILTVKNGEYPYLDHSLESEISSDCKIYTSATLEPFQLYKKLTRKDPESPLPIGQLTQKPEKIKHKIFNWIRTNLFLPDARMGWILPGYLKARKIVQSENIGAIVSSSPPHSLQLIAYLLSKEFKIPWIADFRDPWTEIQYYQVSRRNKVSQGIDQYLERKVLGQANHITTVSSSIGNSFKRKLWCNNPDRKISIIPNGWDPDDFKHDSKPDRKKFIILHTGNLNATQNPMVLLNTLQNLMKMKPDLVRDLKLKFIGRVQENIQKTIMEKDLQVATELIPFLPHQEIISEVQKAAILFSVVPKVPDNKGIVMSKNFEYIGSGLPVLIIGPVDSDIAQIISQFSHSKTIGYDDIKTCQLFVLNSYQNWKKGVVPQSSDNLRERYSRLTLAGKLAEILDQLINK